MFDSVLRYIFSYCVATLKESLPFVLCTFLVLFFQSCWSITDPVAGVELFSNILMDHWSRSVLRTFRNCRSITDHRQFDTSSKLPIGHCRVDNLWTVHVKSIFNFFFCWKCAEFCEGLITFYYCINLKLLISGIFEEVTRVSNGNKGNKGKVVYFA